MRLRTFLHGSIIIIILWLIVPWLLISLNTNFGLPVYLTTISKAVGLIVFMIGIIATLHIVSLHLKTGRVTPVAVEKPLKFIAKGIYRYTRNPMYLAILTAFTGIFIFFGHFLLLLYVLVAVPFLHLFVVYKEEPELKRVFGDQYIEYTKQVPRWFRFKVVPNKNQTTTY